MIDTAKPASFASVDRIVFDRRGAVGVLIEVSGAAQTIESGTVVLSAGTIHSPAILMRSGVGDARQLRALGITTVADLPAVGAFRSNQPSLHASGDHFQVGRAQDAVDEAERFRFRQR